MTAQVSLNAASFSAQGEGGIPGLSGRDGGEVRGQHAWGEIYHVCLVNVIDQTKERFFH